MVGFHPVGWTLVSATSVSYTAPITQLPGRIASALGGGRPARVAVVPGGAYARREAVIVGTRPRETGVS